MSRCTSTYNLARKSCLSLFRGATRDTTLYVTQLLNAPRSITIGASGYAWIRVYLKISFVFVSCKIAMRIWYHGWTACSVAEHVDLQTWNRFFVSNGGLWSKGLSARVFSFLVRFRLLN